MMSAGISDADRLAYSVREKIVFFLHTHFTTIQEVVGSSRALYFQNILFRKFAFDGVADVKITFKELSKKICIDNAMMVLLDGRLNVKGRPNENFSRELFELYTIGKGKPGSIPDSGTLGDYTYFTEKDVQEAARVLSGFDNDNTFSVIDADTLIPRGKIKADGLVPNQHDNKSKTFSTRFANKVIQPDPLLLLVDKPTEASMLDEISQLIEMIYEQDETAKHICRKIYRFYVYHEISDEIETSIINELVITFKANNFKIEPVIKELLQSQHFFDNANTSLDDDKFGAIIKSPLDLVIGTLNFFEYKLPDYTSATELFYKKAGTLLGSITDQGMNFLNPYDVAGYEAYHQFPLYNRHWISANSLARRYKFIFDIMTIENMEDDKINIDLFEFIKLRFSTNALDPVLLIADLASYLLTLSVEETEITKNRFNHFKAQFLKLGLTIPQGAESFWKTNWNLADSSPSNKLDARGMLQDLINALLQSPEYQLQ